MWKHHTIPCVEVGEHQGLVEWDFTEELQQVLHLILENLVSQRMGLHQLVILRQTWQGAHKSNTGENMNRFRSRTPEKSHPEEVTLNLIVSQRGQFTELMSLLSIRESQ